MPPHWHDVPWLILAVVVVVVIVVVQAAAVAVAAATDSVVDSRVRVRYDDHVVAQCVLADSDGDNAIERFYRLAEDAGLDVWDHRIRAGQEFRVSGPRQSVAASLLVADNKASSSYSLLPVSCRVVVENLEEVLSTVELHARRDETEGEDDYFAGYHSFAEAVAYTRDLATQYPDMATFVPSIGRTHEGRDIAAIRLRGPRSTPLKVIYLEGGIHAREWVSVSTVQYVMTKLLTEYARDITVRSLMDSIEFVIVPVANPDGYEYSRNVDRMWRKNRRPADSGSRCAGVDLNRNFDNHWGGIGASSNPCATDYRGPSVASEPETQAIQNFVKSLQKRSGGIDFHSYGQLILRSYGYTRASSPQEEQIREIGDEMRNIIKKTSGADYTSERAADLYPTTGSTDDWMTEGAGMWGWTIELRDRGYYGFQLPANQIKDTGDEIWEAVIYFSDRMLKEGPSSS